jgi:4-hydroxy-3-polyprenylbenzoate decarboxylase
MPYADLREFIARLERENDLVRIKEETDWNLEAGAIMRRCNELGAPAQLFERVKGCPGFRLFGGTLSTFKRLALALDLAPDASYAEILDTYIAGRERMVKPVVVSTGPCKENIQIGDAVDLEKLPAPMLHDGDGGRYIGTWNVGACRDLDSDWVNWGMYRLMLQDRQTTGITIFPMNHAGIIYRKYEDANRPMEYAAFIGNEPVTSLIACSGIPHGVNEVDVVGGVRNQPVELVRCETVNLMVPASSEIVLEGEVLPHERRDEGPFGEYPGYSVSGTFPKPFFKVKAVTHRNNAILTASCLGTPVDECDIAMNIAWCSDLKIDLVRSGLPITGVYIPPESAAHIIVVGTKTPYPGIAFRIASAIWANRNGQYIPRVMVLNEDVDISNLTEVVHAFATKCHPSKGTTLVEHPFNCPLTPYLPAEGRRTGAGGSYAVYDCTWPLDWKPEDIPVKSSFKTIYPKEIQERVLRKWNQYGFAG